MDARDDSQPSFCNWQLHVKQAGRAILISSLACSLVFSSIPPTIAEADPAAHTVQRQVERPGAAEWSQALLDSIEEFPSKGGYYTGIKPNATFPRTTWQSLSDCFSIVDGKGAIDVQRATPSFCSSAVYVAALNALEIINNKYGGISEEAWKQLKPCTGIKDAINPEGYWEDDGFGCWGRANANGPGWAVLAKDLGVGESYTAYRGPKDPANASYPGERYMSATEWESQPIWSRLQTGDLLKIFWDRNTNEENPSDSGAMIGVDNNKDTLDEAGHMVVFLGFTDNGDIRYWSSNGPGKVPAEMGYGEQVTKRTSIQRVVVTHIDNPLAFDNAKDISWDNEQVWLSDLNGKKHGTTAELEQYASPVAVEPVTAHLQASVVLKGGASSVTSYLLVEPLDGAPAPANSQIAVTCSPNGREGISIPLPQFTTVGSYRYRVSQVLPTDDDVALDGIQSHGVTFDAREFNVIVSVAIKNGHLVSTAAIEPAGVISFENRTVSPVVTDPISGNDDKQGENALSSSHESRTEVKNNGKTKQSVLPKTSDASSTVMARCLVAALGLFFLAFTLSRKSYKA